jgi:Protein of unknown function (DUF2029).
MLDRLLRARDRMPSWVQAAGAIAAFGAVATWLTITTWHGLRTSRLDVGLLTDFRDAIYYPVVALRDGVNPYNVDSYYQHYPVGQEFPLYTPIHLLVNAPLLLFSFSTARAVNFGWNLFLVLGLAATALRLAGMRLSTAGVFGLGTLILLSDPGKFDLRTGQPTLMIVIAVSLALRARRNPASTEDSERSIPSAALPIVVGAVALAVVWTKPTFAIPLTVLLLVRGRTRVAALGTTLGIALSAVVLPSLVNAAGGLNRLVQSWQDSARVTSRSKQSKLGSGLRIDVANTFVRVTHLHPSETVGAIGGLLLLAAGAWLVWKLHRRDPDGDREELVITLGCLLILTSAYHVPYDYLLLVGPLLMLARRRPLHAIAWPYRVRPAVIALLIVPMIDPLGWSTINAVLGKSGFEWMLGPTMMSSYVLMALALCGWTAVRQIQLPTTVAAETLGVSAGDSSR